MQWLVAILMLFGSIGLGLAEEQTPPSRLDSIKKGARDWLPDFSLPAAPSLPSLTLPSLPDISMPNFAWASDRLMEEFNAFTRQIGDTLPVLEEMGFDVASFRVQWGLPPKARLRLRSRDTIPADRLAAITARPTSGLLANTLISSAAAAKRIQTNMKLGTAFLDVDFDLPPKVRMSFLNRQLAEPRAQGSGLRTIEDLQVVCGDLLAEN